MQFIYIFVFILAKILYSVWITDLCNFAVYLSMSTFPDISVAQLFPVETFLMSGEPGLD